MLHDFADDYMDKTLMELQMLTPGALEKKSVSLEGFGGKKAKVALRYVGTDGNTMFVDAITIGYPTFDNISILEPFSILYWGFTRDIPFGYQPSSIATVPVFEPITWSNYSDDEADFEWTYEDPKNKGEYLTDNDPYELTVTYEPDYSTDRTIANNFFQPHTLTASAEGATTTSVQSPYIALQAGGKAEITYNDGTYHEYSLMAYDYMTKGLGRVTCEDTKTGSAAIPIFGYENTGSVDNYWLKYSLGEEAVEGEYSHLLGYGNLFMPSAAPLVVNGITAYGYGQVDDDAEFTATIYALDAEMHSERSTYTVVASASCKGADFIKEFEDSKGSLVIPFEFETPVVVKQTPEHMAYLFMIEGFRSDKVKYFAPLQSMENDVMCLGYMMHEMQFGAHQEDYDDLVKSKPMNYRYDINDKNDFADPLTSFAIGLNAEYPWLTCDTEEVTLDGETTVALGSYYDGSKLTVSAPEGVTATVSGRHDKCVLTLKGDASASGEVTVSGPGVSVSINVNKQSGISEIKSAGNGNEEIYDLQGRKVAKPGRGVYIKGGAKHLL